MSTYWLIDGSYLYKSIKSYEKRIGEKVGLDYNKLKEKIENHVNEKLTAYYYNSTKDPATDEQNRFHSWLKNHRNGPGIRVELYQLKKTTVKCPNCSEIFTKYVQKGVDVGIVTAALKFKDSYDNLVLSTGDGDFKDTVKFLSEDLRKRIILVGFDNNLSSDLQPYADSGDMLFIDDFIDEVKDTRYADLEPFDGADEIAEDTE